jgi:predicted TIM-barrel fold metal-dependent hydrolase
VNPERPTWPATGAAPGRFVDAHVHYWQQGIAGLNWPMLAPGFLYPLHRFDNRGRYGPEENRTESTVVPLTKVVHVQAAEAVDPVTETAWLQSMADADSAGWPNAIVGAACLSAPDVGAALERQVAYANFRGVRDVTLTDHLEDRALDSGLSQMAKLRLVCDTMVRLPRFAALAAAADRHPDVVFVLGHAGTPTERTPEFIHRWRDGLQMLAQRPNIVCKVSGFGIGDNDWTAASLAPLVDACIDSFGTGRCIINGNWPVDKLFSTYDELLGAFDVLTAGLTRAERDALFAANAEHVYRI